MPTLAAMSAIRRAATARSTTAWRRPAHRRRPTRRPGTRPRTCPTSTGRRSARQLSADSAVAAGGAAFALQTSRARELLGVSRSRRSDAASGRPEQPSVRCPRPRSIFRAFGIALAAYRAFLPGRGEPTMLNRADEVANLALADEHVLRGERSVEDLVALIAAETD